MFACLSNLKKSCRKFYKEQKLFMTISWKCAEHAQKGPTSQFWGLFGDWKISKSQIKFQFHVLNFGMILLCIGWDLGLGPLIELEDGRKGYDFHLDYFR